MKENKKTIILIIAIVLVIVLLGGGTFAYWQWQTAQNTNVTFTVPGGNAKMTINGGGNITTKNLAPAACTNTTYAIQRKIKVTAENDTTTTMTETIQLKINAFTKGHGSDDDFNAAKASVRWALVRSDSTQHAKSTWGITSCPTSQNGNGVVSETTSGTVGTVLKAGNFGGLSANDIITLYSKDVAAAATASPGTKPTDYYYELYIWIDKFYEGQKTIDTTVTDPLQDMTLNLSWQGSMTNTPTS